MGDIMPHKNIFFGVTALIIQIVFLIVFGVAVRYDVGLQAGDVTHTGTETQTEEQTYHYFKDVLVMMVVGFGFLMTYLKRYGFTASGFNLFLCGLVIQWAIIMNGSHHAQAGIINIGIGSLLGALFTVCGVLISFSCVLGKLGPFQYLVMALIEVPILVGNEYLGRYVLHVVDAGDSIFIHAFGAYFGLGLALAIYRKGLYTHPYISSVYHSDLFAMVGTAFLWIYWPSFNGGTAGGPSQPRAFLNTILSLCGATMAVFIINSFLPPLEGGEEEEKKTLGSYNMVYVQNATLAGGVAVGASCNMMIQPIGALIIGFLAGSFSTLGYRFFTPYVNKVMHDTCGVHNLHGFPSLIAAVASAVAAATATKETYKDELYYIFPAMSPAKNLQVKFYGVDDKTTLDLGRTGLEQGGYQMAAWFITFLISFAGGALTGVIIKYAGMWDVPREEEMFTDDPNWEVPEHVA